MKNLVTIILVVIIAVLLGAHYLLGTDYLKHRQDQETLQAQITRTTRALAQTPGPAGDLESRLATAKSGLAAAKGALPLEVNSTRVIDAILRLAENSQVKAIPLTTKPWAKDTVVTGYYAFRLSMSASGEFPQVSSFIGQLESGEFASVVVESLAVSRVFTTSEGAAPVVAGLTLAIYARSTPAE